MESDNPFSESKFSQSVIDVSKGDTSLIESQITPSSSSEKQSESNSNENESVTEEEESIVKIKQK